MKIATNTILLTVSFIIAILLGEFVIRTIAPQKQYRYPQGMYVNDGLLQYKLAPNFYGVSETTEYETVIETNSIGLRDVREYADKPANTHRILALGDSFTMGVGVNIDDAFVQKLEQKLNQSAASNYEVVNTGVPSYSTTLEVAYLQERGIALQPDLILLNFFIGNDIQDNHSRAEKKVVNGYLRGTGGPGGGFLPTSARDFLQINSHLYLFLWPYQRALFDPEFKHQQQLARVDQLSIYHTVEATQRMWQATKQSLQALKAFADTKSIKTAVLIIPDPMQVDMNRWQSAVSSAVEDTSQYRRDWPNERLMEYCQELDMACLDLLPVFEHHSDKDQLHFAVDGHWTVMGNSIVADEVYRFLLAQQLLFHST